VIVVASNISSMLNNRIRFTGIASGLDTDSLIKQLMKVENMRVDKVKQDKQLLEWKRDDYRSIINKLRSFKDNYFDVLNSSTNMMSAASLSANKVTYGGADTYSAFTATPGSGILPGTYTISNVKVAETAKVSSDGLITGGIVGSGITVGSNYISAANDNNKFTVNFNGTSKEITIDDGLVGIDAVIANLQSKIDTAFGTEKITVGKTGAGNDQITFSTDSTNVLSISAAYNTGSSALLGKTIGSNFVVNSQNNKFTVAYNDGTPITIEVPTGTYNADTLAKAIQEKIDDGSTGLKDKVRVLNQNNTIVLKAIEAPAVATGNITGVDVSGENIAVDANNKVINVTIGGTNNKQITLTEKTYATSADLLKEVQSKLNSAFGSNKVIVSLDDAGALRFEEISSDDTIKTGKVENGGLAALGLKDVNVSNKLSMNLTIVDLANKLVKGFTPADENTDNNPDNDVIDIRFTINGKLFEFKSTQTLNEIVSAVNNDPDAKVKMSYDQLNDRFIVESKEYGKVAKVDIDDVDGGLMDALGLHGLNDTGEDASIDFDDGTGVQTITRDSNNFTINGISFSLKANSAEEVELKLEGDPSKTLDLIKGFVAKYNEVVDMINGELNEKRNRDYAPLTDEQKEALSDSEVEKWEEKARSGMLSNDSLLRGLLSDMRNCLFQGIEGVDGTLQSIGISTGTWEQRGKLVINETKLKDAITNNPDLVTSIFTKESTTRYSSSMDAAAKAKRNEENGIASRLDDILQDYIRTSGDKGSLLQRAGITGDRSEIQNTLSEQINAKVDMIATLLDKLTEKEDRYYKQFAAMEKALSEMNSQSSWLSQQFGG
jgi:flagellar hook-associated protein 2